MQRLLKLGDLLLIFLHLLVDRSRKLLNQLLWELIVQLLYLQINISWRANDEFSDLDLGFFDLDADVLLGVGYALRDSINQLLQISAFDRQALTPLLQLIHQVLIVILDLCKMLGI